MSLVELRSEVFARDGDCVWPGCDTDRLVHPLQLAHLRHRGMGGSPSANTPDNCVTLCSQDHDVLDGRAGLRLSVCRIRTAFDAYRQERRYRQISHGSTRPPTATGCGGGESGPDSTSKSWNTGSSTDTSPPPNMSITATTTRSTTGTATWNTSQPPNTPAATDNPKSTTKQLGVDIRTVTPLPKSPQSSVYTRRPSAAGGDRWATGYEPSGEDRKRLSDAESTPSRSQICTWPECDQPASPPNLEQLQRWSDRGCVTLDCHRIPPDDPLCELHWGICQDGRTGLGILRSELNLMLRTAAGLD